MKRLFQILTFTPLFLQAQTKFYLPSTSALPPVSPAFNSGWAITTGADRIMCYTDKRNTSITSKTTGNSSSVQKILNRQYISQPLLAQTLSGTVKGQLRGSESNPTMDGVTSIGIFVCNVQGTIVATLLAITNPPLSGNEYSNSLTNKNTPVSSALSSYNCANGDRLVIEIGVSQKGNSNNRNVTQSFGDNSATDLPEDQTTTTANNPWLQFSTTIKLQPSYIHFF
jgi:hypothetical protein